MTVICSSPIHSNATSKTPKKTDRHYDQAHHPEFVGDESHDPGTISFDPAIFHELGARKDFRMDALFASIHGGRDKQQWRSAGLWHALQPVTRGI